MFYIRNLFLVISFLCSALITSGESMGNVTSPTYNGFFGFSDGVDQAVEYEYDANGNMTRDRNKGISSIQYNADNLPLCIQYDNGSRATYLYTADGTKLQVRYETSYAGLLSSGSTGGSTSTAIAQTHTIDYVGNKIYEDGTLKKILVDGGYVEYNGGSPVYHAYLTDHQGNVRVVVSENVTVKQVNHYYPYGSLFAESTGGDVQRYKYNGKELDRMHGLDWYDHGARHNDAAIGRWHSMDQLCEKYYDVSPYAYCGGDPVNATDPDGDTIIYMRPIVEKGQIIRHEKFSYLNINGNYGFYDKSGNIYNGGNTYLTNLQSALGELVKGEVGAGLIKELSGQYNVEIRHGYNGITGNNNSSIIEWDSQEIYGGGIDENGDIKRPAFIGLGHELAHAVDFKNNTFLKGDWISQTQYTNRVPNYEKYACYIENLIRKEHNIPMRKYYSSKGEKGYKPTLIQNKPYW